MASLGMTYDDLRSEVGLRAGWGSTSTAWSADKTTTIKNWLKTGLRRFYFNQMGYAWTFMKPVESLTIPSGASSLLLPTDFGFLSGPLFYYDSTAVAIKIEQVALGQIWSLRSRSMTLTGPPLYAAISPRREHGEDARQVMELYPTADAAYTVKIRFSVTGEALDTLVPVARGGPAHTETVRQACLSEMEAFIFGTRGIHEQQFQEALAASIAYDSKLKSQHYGMVEDCSDETDAEDLRTFNAVTYNGVTY